MLTLLVITAFAWLSCRLSYRYCLRRLVSWFSTPTWTHRSRRTQPPGNSHRYTRAKPAWLKAEIIRLKATMPQVGCRSIAILCNRRYAAARKVTVGKTYQRLVACGLVDWLCSADAYVNQVLRQHRYEIDILRRKLKHIQPRPLLRNLIWGVDLTGKTDTSGNLHSILGILDHGSRAVLCLQALNNKSSRMLLSCLLAAINIYGKPKVIRTDNEAIFTSRLFQYGLKLLGIRHQRTDPGCPWQNGRIERFFGTLKQQLDQLTYSPPPQAGEGLGKREGVRVQLNRDLSIFRFWFNHVRPHQNLNGKTPAEAWHGVNPYAKSPKAEYAFHAWEGLLTGYYLRY